MSIDQLFQRSVALIGAGDVPALERLLTEHPELASERLAAPGPWLRDKIGGALDGFFKDPYLLWFVAEDVPVLGRLPKNIAEVARAILRSAQASPEFQEQLDSTLRLICWSGVAQRCGVQGQADYWYTQPIHFAVREGHIEAVQILLESGGDPEWNGYHEGSLIEMARDRGHERICTAS